MRMQNLSRLESKEIYFNPIDVTGKREFILQDAITTIDRFFKYYENFIKDENFFNLSRMWIEQCDKYCKNLREKLKYIADSKFQKNFRNIMKKIEKQVKIINKLIDKKTDEQIIKESVWVAINQLTAILWNLREELREKL